MLEYVSKSYEDTLAYAERFAKKVKKGSTIAFLGDLGAGKTAFATGFVKGLGIDAEVSSPTFAIVNIYSGNGKTVYHYDMYRVESWEDLYTTGFLDAFDSDAYILIEWSENVFGALDSDTVFIKIVKLGENGRKITIMNREEAEKDFASVD